MRRFLIVLSLLAAAPAAALTRPGDLSDWTGTWLYHARIESYSGSRLVEVIRSADGRNLYYRQYNLDADKQANLHSTAHLRRDAETGTYTGLMTTPFREFEIEQTLTLAVDTAGRLQITFEPSCPDCRVYLENHTLEDWDVANFDYMLTTRIEQWTRPDPYRIVEVRSWYPRLETDNTAGTAFAVPWQSLDLEIECAAPQGPAAPCQTGAVSGLPPVGYDRVQPYEGEWLNTDGTMQLVITPEPSTRSRWRRANYTLFQRQDDVWAPSWTGWWSEENRGWLAGYLAPATPGANPHQRFTYRPLRRTELAEIGLPPMVSDLVFQRTEHLSQRGARDPQTIVTYEVWSHLDETGFALSIWDDRGQGGLSEIRRYVWQPD